MSKNTGTISDKLAVAAARVAGTAVEEAVVKATRTDMLPPKEKHVRALIVATNDGSTMPGDIVDAIMRRLESWDWNVVLKTLMLSHRLIREGSQRFVAELKYRPTVFPLQQFTDSNSPLGIKNSPFVRKYATFLEEKVNVFKTLKVEIDKKPHALKDLGVDDIFAKVPKLQSLFNALLNCRIAKADLNNTLIVAAFTYLLKDSFVLYQALNEATINLLERFFSMQLVDAKKGLEIYKLFCKETNSLISLYDQCKSFTSSVPDLTKAPEELLKSMEKYINDLESGAVTAADEDGVSDGAGDEESESASNEPEPAPVVVKKKDKAAAKAKKAAAAEKARKKAEKAERRKQKEAAAAAKAKKAGASSKRKGTAAEAPVQTNLLDFDDFDMPGTTPAAAASPAADFNPFGASPAAAPAATGGLDDLFDPFGTSSTPATAAAVPAGVDEKLARIQLVQQMSSSGAGATLLSSDPLTPEPVNPFAAPAGGAAAEPFNPFPQQPLKAQETNDAWSNPFA